MFAAQTVYLYIGAFVLILVLVLSTSAACFLRRHQLRKTSSNSSSKFPKPGSSTATTQLIPPPPKLQPPQLPPFKSPGRNNNRINGLMTPNNYQTRTLPRSVYEENHLYEASSPMPPYWPGATLETDYDSDPNLPPGRLIQPYPSMYSCTRDMHNDSSTVMGSYSRR